MTRVAVVVITLLVTQTARADDCDFTDIATGTWTTGIAESIDQCMADPTCANAGAAHPVSSAEVPPVRLPERGLHGHFAGGTGTIGWVSDGQLASMNGDGRVSTGGHIAARGAAGWYRGIQTCGHTDLVAGTEHSSQNGAASLRRSTTGFDLAFPVMFMGVALGGEQAWQLRPSLASQRVWLRRTYAVQDVHAGFGVAVWRDADGSTSTILPLRFSLRTQSQDDYRSVFRTWRFALYEHSDPDHGHTEVLPTELEAMYPEGIGTDRAPKPASSVLAHVDVAKVKRTIHGVTLEASVGGLFSDRDLACEACAPIAGGLHATWLGNGGTWAMGVDRTAHLAMDDTITVEDRITAGYQHPSKAVTWRGGVFAALSRTTRDQAIQPIGGSSLGADIALPDKVQLAVDLEVARSYYGRLDGDPTPTPELAGLGSVRLERRFNVNPPRL